MVHIFDTKILDMNMPRAVIRRRLVNILRTYSLPQLRGADFLYISLSLLIGFGLGLRTVSETVRSTPVQAAEQQLLVPPVLFPSPTPIDKRVKKLESYLQSQQSPLAPYAQVIIDEADHYAIDWTRMAAIAGMESAYGKLSPEGSHNAWGMGGVNFMYFSSWEEGIKFTAQVLGQSYKHDEVLAIKKRYCPSSDGCNPIWAQVVTDISNKILSMKI